MTQIKTEPEMEPMNRLLRIKTISDEAHSLKTERNPGKSSVQNILTNGCVQKCEFFFYSIELSERLNRSI